MTVSLPTRNAVPSAEPPPACLRGSHVPMVLADPHRPRHPMVFCNRAFCDLTGYAEAEIIGRDLSFLQGPRSDPAALATLRDGIARLEEVQVEVWNYRKDGTAFWNVMTVGPVFDQAGLPLFLLGNQLDAGARRDAVDAIRRRDGADAILRRDGADAIVRDDADEARLRAGRLDTLGSMAAEIAHEFNNLMTVAMGSLEAVTSEPLTPRQQERIERALWATNAAGRLTRQMLSQVQRRDDEPRRVDLGAAVGAIDRVLTQLSGPSMAFEVVLAPEPLPVRVDVGQLELAVINLVRNAADACGPGARITVATRRGEDGSAELAVGDTGGGMSPELMRRATQPFFTTKPHGKGTGLGLSMVRRFVEGAGGALLIASELGRGTTVRMVFPLHEQADEP